MKAEVEKTFCLLDVAGKCSVKTSVKVPVKGIKEEKRKGHCSCQRKG